MQCFNCGNDANMEVFMMINGKMKKINICMDCYQEQVQKMMDQMSDENGEFDPDIMQKNMFEFFQNHKDEFEKFLGEAIDDENFDISQLRPENFDIQDMNFENMGFDLSQTDVNDIFKEFNNQRKGPGVNPNLFGNLGGTPRERMRSNPYNENREITQREREVKVLENAAKRKRAELNEYIANEDYLRAASSRDEMREINKNIMIIKELAKEGEK